MKLSSRPVEKPENSAAGAHAGWPCRPGSCGPTAAPVAPRDRLSDPIANRPETGRFDFPSRVQYRHDRREAPLADTRHSFQRGSSPPWSRIKDLGVSLRQPSGLPATSELKRSIVRLRGEGPHRLCRVAVEFRFVVKRYAAALLNRHAFWPTPMGTRTLSSSSTPPHQLQRFGVGGPKQRRPYGGLFRFCAVRQVDRAHRQAHPQRHQHGIGGSYLGPEMAYRALRPFCDPNIAVRFVANVDGADFTKATQGLDPHETLFIIASKTFTTLETMTNAVAARRWVLSAIGAEEGIARHFVALSTNAEAVEKFGSRSPTIRQASRMLRGAGRGGLADDTGAEGQHDAVDGDPSRLGERLDLGQRER